MVRTLTKFGCDWQEIGHKSKCRKEFESTSIKEVLQMSWNLDSSRPIYAQIIEKVSLDIVSGKYQPGDKLPSVRDLAAQAGVNPNTMQKALSELERENLVHSARTSGRFITEDKAMIEKMREELASTQIKEFLNKMSQMGFDYEKTITLLEKLGKENQK